MEIVCFTMSHSGKMNPQGDRSDTWFVGQGDNGVVGEATTAERGNRVKTRKKEMWGSGVWVQGQPSAHAKISEIAQEVKRLHEADSSWNSWHPRVKNSLSTDSRIAWECCWV